MTKRNNIVPVQPATDRTIITTYFVDSRRLESVKVIRSKVPRAAVTRAIDYMRFDYFTACDNKGRIVAATVAVVHDEEIGKDLVIVSKDIQGRLTVDECMNPKKYETKKFGTFKIRPDRVPVKEQIPKNMH